MGDWWNTVEAVGRPLNTLKLEIQNDHGKQDCVNWIKMVNCGSILQVDYSYNWALILYSLGKLELNVSSFHFAAHLQLVGCKKVTDSVLNHTWRITWLKSLFAFIFIWIILDGLFGFSQRGREVSGLLWKNSGSAYKWNIERALKTKKRHFWTNTKCDPLKATFHPLRNKGCMWEEGRGGQAAGFEYWKWCLVAIGNWLPGSVAASIPKNKQEYLESGEAEKRNTFVVAYDMMQRRLPVS